MTSGYIRGSIRPASPDAKLLAYKTFVSPQLECTSVIWKPHQGYLIDGIQSLLNKAVVSSNATTTTLLSSNPRSLLNLTSPRKT